MAEGQIKHVAKPSALLASRPRSRAIFPVVHKRCFNWFSVIYEAFKSTIVLTFEFRAGDWRDMVFVCLQIVKQCRKHGKLCTILCLQLVLLLFRLYAASLSFCASNRTAGLKA